MGIMGKVAKKVGKAAAVILVAKMIAPSDADAQTRFYGHAGVFFGNNFGNNYGYYQNYGNLNYGYGNPCGPPAQLYQQYYNLYNLYAASTRVPVVQPGVVVGQPYYYYNQYVNADPVPRYRMVNGYIYNGNGVPVDNEDKFREMQDEIDRLKKIVDNGSRNPDGYRPDDNKDDNKHKQKPNVDDGKKPDDKPDRQPYSNEKEFSYVMRYSGKVCDNQLDDVTIGYLEKIFDCERENTNWGSDYAVYDIGSYKLAIRDNNSKKIGEINLRKYSGKNGKDIISEIKNDLRSLNIVGNESIDRVRVDFRNYSCEN
ncbi:hypothetical protein HYZ41_02035 [archaeon]|nr:hypothetical protein [archaeon]